MIFLQLFFVHLFNVHFSNQYNHVKPLYLYLIPNFFKLVLNLYHLSNVYKPLKFGRCFIPFFSA